MGAIAMYPLLGEETCWQEVLPGISMNFVCTIDAGELLVRGLLSRVALRAADELDPRRKSLAAVATPAGSSSISSSGRI